LIADTAPRISLNCNGSLKTFSFTFPLIVSSDLTVKLLNTVTNVAVALAETTDYSVADPDGVSGVLADYSNGGTITTTATLAYPSSYKIILERSVPYTQAADFTEGMPTLYANFESALDKLTMQVQQLRDKLDRSPYGPAEDPTTLDMEMPNATTRAGKYAYYDANGEPTAVAVINAGTLSLSAWAETLVDADNAAEGRAVLELDNLTNDVQAKADFTGYDEKTVLNDNDILLMNDSETSNTVKKVSVGNLRSLPAGALVDWPVETEPDGWFERDGTSLLRADYPALFAIIGVRFGAADGTHFSLPDDRGLFPRWWAHGSTNDPDRAARTDRGDGTGGDVVGSKQAGANVSHTHTANAHNHSASATATTTLGEHNNTVCDSASVMMTVGGGGTVGPPDTTVGGAQWRWYSSLNCFLASTSVSVTNVAATSTINATGGNESRPANRAYMPLIKYI